MIRVTKRAYALVVISATLVGATFLTPGPVSVATASVAVFLLLLIVSSRASLSAQVGALGRLLIEKRVSKPLIEGREASIEVTFRNDSVVPIELLEVKIPYPASFKLVKGSPNALVTIPPKSVVKVGIGLIPRVGEHLLPPPKLVLRDWLGMFRYVAEVGKAEVIRVYPRVEPVKSFMIIYSARPGGLSRAKRRGHGVEFFGLREYVPGDEYRRIEWKASARYGLQRLFVKEFEHEVSLNLFFLLDTSRYMLSGGWGETPLEYSVRAVASIASYALRRGDSVCIIHYFTKVPKLIRGRASLPQVISELSRLPWDSIVGIRESRVAELVSRKLVKVMPRERNVVMVFTSLYGGAEEVKALIDSLSMIRSLGNAVMVVVPMVEFFEVRTLKGFQAAVYRVRTIHAIKAKLEAINTLLSHGIPTVTALPKELSDLVVRRLEMIRASIT